MMTFHHPMAVIQPKGKRLNLPLSLSTPAPTPPLVTPSLSFCQRASPQPPSPPQPLSPPHDFSALIITIATRSAATTTSSLTLSLNPSSLLINND